MSEGRAYTLAHRALAQTLAASLAPAELRERHRALAAVYASTPGLAAVHHMLEGGLEERALERLFALLGTLQSTSSLQEVFVLDALNTAATFARALRAAQDLARPPREIVTLHRWLASLSVAADDRYYWMSAPHWLEQLKQDSGYAAWVGAADVGRSRRAARSRARRGLRALLRAART